MKKEDESAISLLADERIEDLQCAGLKIIQNKKLYTFTSDSVVLANFVKTNAKDTAVEIGTGCGVISILVQAKNNLKKILAFEIQPQLFDLAKKNVVLNNLEEKIEVECDDAKNFTKYLKKSSADVVFCNPPYFKPTSFPQTSINKIAKEEVALSCEKLCQISSEMLKDKGVLYVCYPADRTCELVYTLQKYGLSTKELFFTENGKKNIKTLFLKAVKNGKFGTKILPNLVTNDENGEYLDILKTRHFLK